MPRIEMDWSGPEPVAVYNGRLWYPVIQWWDKMVWFKEAQLSDKVSSCPTIILSTRRCPVAKTLNALEYDQEHGEHPQWAEVVELKPYTLRMGESQVSLVWDKTAFIWRRRNEDK